MYRNIHTGELCHDDELQSKLKDSNIEDWEPELD
jgi:hypothetical protein